MRCVAGGERGEKKNEEAMGEGAHVLLAAAIMISCGHQDGTCQAVSLSRQGSARCYHGCETGAPTEADQPRSS